MFLKNGIAPERSSVTHNLKVKCCATTTAMMANLLVVYCLIVMASTSQSTSQQDDTFLDFVDHHHKMCPSVKDTCDKMAGMMASIGDQTSGIQPSDFCCGFCTCDDACGNRTCCLAAYDSFEEAILFSNMANMERRVNDCIKPKLLQPHQTRFPSNERDEAYWMITTCKTVTGQRQPCELPSLEGDVKSVIPVTYYEESTQLRLHYMNRQCALCNDVAKSAPLVEWDFEINCDSSLSVTDEKLLATIAEKGCNVFYLPPRDYYVETCTIPPTYQISSCNETGLWKNFNETIDKACKAFVDPFNQTYKNFFCYLCNVDNALPQEEWSCKDPYERQVGPTPTFSVKLTTDFIEKMKTDQLLGCDSENQFPDLKSMVCRDISCAWNAPQRYELCELGETIMPQNVCFVLFAKLTPMDEVLESYTHTTQLQYAISGDMTSQLPRESIYESQVYMKTRKRNDSVLIIDYLVVKLSFDTIGYAMSRAYVDHMESHNTNIDTLEVVTQMHVEFAYYNATFDQEGNLLSPSSDNKDVDVLIKIYEYINDDVTAAYSETTPIYLKKVHMFPFVTVALHELTFKFNQTHIIIYAGTEEFAFSEWEYNLLGQLVQISLEDFKKIYNAMPESPSLNGARTLKSTNQYLIGSSFIVLSLSIFKNSSL